MLLNDFFKINDLILTDDELVSNISLLPEHAIFKGHFPGNPVTPGVVQMQIVKEILETHFEKKLQMESMSRCKFLNILSPKQTKELAIKINIRESEKVINVSASGTEKDLTFFKFNAIYQYQ